MSQLITEDEFAAALSGFTCSAFRLEAQPLYAMTYEREDFERYLAGNPTPPDQMDWYLPWMEQVSAWTQAGKTLTRVRVLAEPPTDYQNWLTWGAPWFASIGEDIRYMKASRARRIGLPPDDWWLLDGDTPDARVIFMRFTGAGEIIGRELITGPDVARFRDLQMLALANSAVESLTA